MTVPATFAQERELFAARLSELLPEHRDEFVVIRGSDIVGFGRTQPEAVRRGVEALGIVPFLVRQVTEAAQPVRLPALAMGW